MKLKLNKFRFEDSKESENLGELNSLEFNELQG